MSVYFIAQLSFTEVEAYRRYMDAFPSVFARHGGRVLVADEAPILLEGALKPDKVVVLEFSGEAEASRLLNDPDYQRISLDRKAGADAVVVMVRGSARNLVAPARVERSS
ncbi:DUF1330 domain-containing protein [Brevundimonas sp. VNH65]|uniref:DUF1330 domain-containing protein n=1 Tax=Brevundimonas sp. VNH65 TaxID=3400917 RepID=UPI000A392553|nr:DUF1330 domain-containing protein [Novosphingobium panipatense]